MAGNVREGEEVLNGIMDGFQADCRGGQRPSSEQPAPCKLLPTNFICGLLRKVRGKRSVYALPTGLTHALPPWLWLTTLLRLTSLFSAPQCMACAAMTKNGQALSCRFYRAGDATLQDQMAGCRGDGWGGDNP